MNEFIDSLELPFEGEMRGKQYWLELKNSNEFSQAFSLISMNNKLNLEDDSKATTKESEFRFTDGYYEVLLKADYDNDVYQMTIEEK